jgi:hypothetical protein
MAAVATADERTRCDARIEDFRRWAVSVGYQGFDPGRLSSEELDRLLELRPYVATRDPDRRGSYILGKASEGYLNDEEYGFWRRRMRKANATGPASDDSDARQLARLAASFETPDDEAAAGFAWLREWATSAEMPAEILTSRILADDVASGQFEAADLGVFVAILLRIADSANGVAEVTDRGRDTVRPGWEASGGTLGKVIDWLTVADWLDSSPPQMQKGRGRVWSIGIGPRAAACGDQSKRWRQLVIDEKARRAA